MMPFKLFVRLAFSLLLLVGGFQAFAADKPLRIGTLAPKNSLYYRQLIEVAEAWKGSTGSGAKYHTRTSSAWGPIPC